MLAGQQPIRLQKAISVLNQWPGLGSFICPAAVDEVAAGGPEGLRACEHRAINIKTSSQLLLLSVRKQSALSFVVFFSLVAQEGERATLNIYLFLRQCYKSCCMDLCLSCMTVVSNAHVCATYSQKANNRFQDR